MTATLTSLKFLPFLMMSDRFMNRALEISVGSLSPTTNWTTLKLETFDLPPLDQQRRIAEILWAVDDSLNRNSETEGCSSAIAGKLRPRSRIPLTTRWACDCAIPFNI